MDLLFSHDYSGYVCDSNNKPSDKNKRHKCSAVTCSWVVVWCHFFHISTLVCFGWTSIAMVTWLWRNVPILL